jgi:hypothetical protein
MLRAWNRADGPWPYLQPPHLNAMGALRHTAGSAPVPLLYRAKWAQIN